MIITQAPQAADQANETIKEWIPASDATTSHYLARNIELNHTTTDLYLTKENKEFELHQ